MTAKKKVLYIGGFELPDKNAAAQRVIGIAKGLRELNYDVVFLNSLKRYDKAGIKEKEYFGFKCYEYKRESEADYLLTARTCLKNIEQIQPNIVIAYNYPGFALERVRKYCKNHNIYCFADVTEWYRVKEGNLLYQLIKFLDTSYRMRVVQKKMDGVIAISRFLNDYYKEYTNTVMIPPVVDIMDEKWTAEVEKNPDYLSFVYAGTPTVQKERLDLIVDAIEEIPVNKLVRLNIVGITEDQFRKIYKRKQLTSDRIKFWGRIDHKKVIEIIKGSNWSIIIRDNNFVVNAGFPTKLVESISCGTPVIINRFSNVEEYVDKDNGILLTDVFDLSRLLKYLNMGEIDIRQDIFDYRLYLDQIICLFST